MIHSKPRLNNTLYFKRRSEMAGIWNLVFLMCSLLLYVAIQHVNGRPQNEVPPGFAPQSSFAWQSGPVPLPPGGQVPPGPGLAPGSPLPPGFATTPVSAFNTGAGSFIPASQPGIPPPPQFGPTQFVGEPSPPFAFNPFNGPYPGIQQQPGSAPPFGFQPYPQFGAQPGSAPLPGIRPYPGFPAPGNYPRPYPPYSGNCNCGPYPGFPGAGGPYGGNSGTCKCNCGGNGGSSTGGGGYQGGGQGGGFTGGSGGSSSGAGGLISAVLVALTNTAGKITAITGILTGVKGSKQFIATLGQLEIVIKNLGGVVENLKVTTNMTEKQLQAILIGISQITTSLDGCTTTMGSLMGLIQSVEKFIKSLTGSLSGVLSDLNKSISVVSAALFRVNGQLTSIVTSCNDLTAILSSISGGSAGGASVDGVINQLQMAIKNLTDELGKITSTPSGPLAILLQSVNSVIKLLKPGVVTNTVKDALKEVQKALELLSKSGLPKATRDLLQSVLTAVTGLLTLLVATVVATVDTVVAGVVGKDKGGGLIPGGLLGGSGSGAGRGAGGLVPPAPGLPTGHA